MSENTKFDPIPRLQQIASMIANGVEIDCPETQAYYIECAIAEMQQLRTDLSNATRVVKEFEESRRKAIAALHWEFKVVSWTSNGVMIVDERTDL